VPEGDTIHRSASVLRSALVGHRLVGFDAPRLTTARPRLGSLVEDVVSRGKHVEIIFDDAMVLHTHMMMSGSWHLYRHGERWRRSPHKLRAALEVPDWLAVCFSAPVVETYRLADRRRHACLGSLGPDLCRDDADIGEAVARMARFAEADVEIGDVLLDQRVAAGIGNVYKSEVLWACGLDPQCRLGDVPMALRTRLVNTAAAMLRANLHGGTRRTTSELPGGLAVYGRAGKPCVRCHAPIEVFRHGRQARVTFACGSCQFAWDDGVHHAPISEPRLSEPRLSEPR
jgi:endonuclease VIII